MHWKGFRIGVSNNHNSKRQPAIDSRYSEQLLRSTQTTVDVPARRSESTAHPTAPMTTADEDTQAEAPTESITDDSKLETTATGVLNSRRNRFSFMRPRHASDPQLSKSYAKGEQDIPPVPSLPLPPTIITTAPTSQETDQSVRQSSRLSFFGKSQSYAGGRAIAGADPDSEGKNDNAVHGVDCSMRPLEADHGLVEEEPGRLSTNSWRSGGREHHPSDSYRSSVAEVRFSESSRSDHSQGDRWNNLIGSSHDSVGVSSKRNVIRLPRLKRSRGPLFPLLPRVPTPEPLDGHAPKQTASGSDISNARGQDHISPLPSPTHSTVRLSSQGPGSASRRDSTTSARSANSNHSTNVRDIPRHRERASTMDSILEPNEQSSLHLASSGRTSTSTNGRKSFGDMLNFSSRFRQNSEPPPPHSTSPGISGAMALTSMSISFNQTQCPEREESDTPATYLRRLEENIPKSTIAGILAISNDEFYKSALRKYMRGFSFFGDPIDMSIRKLLMEVELPKETQQIDRFLQAFADRYQECNPGIFTSADQTYFIAFSILILHTDVFNKNNKRKMQKLDYVKNTRGEGIADDILECIYENISYTPFIHIEDANTRPHHLSRPKWGVFKSVSTENLSFASKEPVDPYALILEGKLDSLRPSLAEVMNLDDTYTCTGSSGPPDINDLHETFAKSGILQIVSARSRPGAFMQTSFNSAVDSNPGLVDIKVAKVGLLWRKDPKKKKARSPWREWGVLLTFSQMYLFQDTSWVKSLISQHSLHQKNGRRRTVVFTPPLIDFKPDGIMSTENAVALLDSGYKRHKHAFLFIRHNCLEEVFLANSEADMDDWLAVLNYAAAFRTTGVRTKGMIASNYEGQRYRVSRTTSNGSLDQADEGISLSTTEADVAEEFVMARRDLMCQRAREATEKLAASHAQLENLLRNARNLQAMTPIHARTRELVIAAAGRMSAKIRWARQDIWRTRCYREILLRDLGEETESIAGLEQSPADTNPVDPELSQISPVDQLPNGPALQILPSTFSSTNVAPVSQDSGTKRPSAPASEASSEHVLPGRHHSTENIKERAEPIPLGATAGDVEREPSIPSIGSKIDVSSLGSHCSKHAAPASIDDDEERVLREAGVLDISSSRPDVMQPDDSEQKTDEPRELSRMDRTKRMHLSLQRTLHSSRHESNSEHNQNKKSRESMPSAPAGDEANGEGEGLSRKAPNFTFHGKKASIVTFGTEWQIMAPEERLKQRKPTPSSEQKASDLSVISNMVMPHLVVPEFSDGHLQQGVKRGDQGNTYEDGTQALQATSKYMEISAPPEVHTWNGGLAVSGEDRTTSGAASSYDEVAESMQGETQCNVPKQAVNA